MSKRAIKHTELDDDDDDDEIESSDASCCVMRAIVALPPAAMIECLPPHRRPLDCFQKINTLDFWVQNSVVFGLFRLR